MSLSTFGLCGAFALLILMIFILTPDNGFYDFKCSHCGYNFDADEVEFYFAIEDDILPYRFYDACDCPNCGCQLIIGRRLEEVE